MAQLVKDVLYRSPNYVILYTRVICKKNPIVYRYIYRMKIPFTWLKNPFDHKRESIKNTESNSINSSNTEPNFKTIKSILEPINLKPLVILSPRAQKIVIWTMNIEHQFYVAVLKLFFFLNVIEVKYLKLYVVLKRKTSKLIKFI